MFLPYLKSPDPAFGFLLRKSDFSDSPEGIYALLSVSINISTRWQISKKEGIFRENECRQYDGTARLIFAESKKQRGFLDDNRVAFKN